MGQFTPQPEKWKAEISRSEYRTQFIPRFQELTWSFSEWKTERDFIEEGFDIDLKSISKNKEYTEEVIKSQYKSSISDISPKYLEFVKRLREVWLLVKYYLKSLKDTQRDEIDLKITKLAKTSVTTQEAEDVYNEVSRLFSQLVPLEEEAAWRGFRR